MGYSEKFLQKKLKEVEDEIEFLKTKIESVNSEINTNVLIANSLRQKIRDLQKLTAQKKDK